MFVRPRIHPLLWVLLMLCVWREAAAQSSSTPTLTASRPRISVTDRTSSTLESSFPPSREVIYKTVRNAKLRMAIFEPAKEKVKGKAPVIVFFFGGDWRVGRRNQFYPACAYFAERGFLACAAEYRTKMVDRDTSPFDCVADGKSAIRWLRQNATKLDIDADRIVAAGASAGGHVAACAALIQGFDDPNDNKAFSCVPNALILLSAVVDTTSQGYGWRRLGERGQEISPAHHVAKGAPPTILFHGTADKVVPLENVQRFARLMREAGNVCKLVTAEGQGQGYFNHPAFRRDVDPKWFNETMQKAYDFLKKQRIARDLPAGRKAAALPPSPSAKPK